MKRSTNIAPLSLSTSYLIGSAFIGISMITLNSSGARAPGETLCRLMAARHSKRRPDGKRRREVPAGQDAEVERARLRHPLTSAGLPEPCGISRPGDGLATR